MPAGSTVYSRRLRGARLRLVLLPLACALDLPDACANDLDDVEFDAGMLKQRGIDPKLAGYFRQAPRFTAGRHVVSLTVNGKLMGRAQANFDETGALCVDRELLDAADIVVTSASACTDLVALLPSASVELYPARGAVSLLVPTDVLRTPQQDVSGYARGGTAALLNYEVIGLDSRWSSSGSRYGSANTELGINAGDWVIRSRQVATSSDGRYRTALLDTYAQRSFAEHRAVLQLGELNIMNPALAGAQITGVQVTSEQALATQAGGAIVEGVASSQARVDVRQDGVLVYSTVVPAGPFALTSIPRINRHGRLDVTVVGAGGEKQQFVVSPAMAGSTRPSAGYSLALGRTRNLGGIDAPWVASVGWSGPLHRRVTLSSGAMLASGYQSIGVGLGSSLATTTQLQIDVVGSRAARDRAFGLQGTLTLSQRLSEQWSAAYSSTLQSGGFRELVDTARIGAATARRTRYRDQSSSSLSWSHPGLGNLSAGYSQTVLFDGRTTKRALASWGARMGRASVSVSAEWNLSQSRRSGDNAIYFNASVPLGDSGRIGTTVRRYVGETRYGTSFSEQVNEFASYRAGFEYRSGDRRRSLTSAVSLLPRYVQLDASYAQDTRSRSVSLALRGGLVLHDHGVTASPYAVRDTFGVLSVGDTAGVRVSTPGGQVWTDGRGYAVLPQLSPYGKSGIEVATDSLPRNIDIQGGAAVIQAGRGAVTTLDFPVRKTRRVLVSARMDDGRVLPFGATATDGQGDVVGVVQGGGEVFVPNILATPHLTVRHADIPDCELDIRLDEHHDLNAYYESAAAVCQPGGEGLR
jgi:outer membrane usher protein FimD/PapC